MINAVIYAFAFDENLPQVEAAAPYKVLARQIPRLISMCMNGREDRRVRFFPFMGQVEGRRQFFEMSQLMPAENLLSLHGQKTQPKIIVDGLFDAEGFRLRVHDGEAGGVIFDDVLEFDPQSPRPAIQRIVYEMVGALGWAGAPPPLPELDGMALGWYLIARDDLLGLEANLLCADPDLILRAATQAFELEPHAREVQQVMVDIGRRMVQGQLNPQLVGAVMKDAADKAPDAAVDFMVDAGVLVEVTVGPKAAVLIYERAATLDPKHILAAVKAGAHLYQSGQMERLCTLLWRSHECGVRDPKLIAQLAAAEEQCGNFDQRNKLVAGLIGEKDLPSIVSRMVVSYLTEEQRLEEALEEARRALEKDPDHAGLLLEHGRALLALHRGDEAKEVLEHCLRSKPTESTRGEARRFLTFTANPVILPDVAEIEASLASGDIKQGLALARTFARKHKDLPEAWLFLGIARQRLEQYRRAIRCYRRALELRPGMGDAHNRLGILLAIRGQIDEAYGHLRQAVELIPHEASPWLHLAQVCQKLDKADEGREALDRAEKIGTQNEKVEIIRQGFAQAS